MRNICHICTDVRDVFNIEADRRFPDNDERHYRYICQDCLANIILGSDYKVKQEAKIAELERMDSAQSVLIDVKVKKIAELKHRNSLLAEQNVDHTIKIAELEAEIDSQHKKIMILEDRTLSVADELEEKIKTMNVGRPINPMICAIHIKPSIERLRGKVPEQYNYDTPAKPATDHEEVASDSYIQKQREKSR